jgi:hypothetical protein
MICTIGSIKSAWLRRTLVVLSMPVLYPLLLVVSALISITEEMPEVHKTIKSSWRGRQ